MPYPEDDLDAMLAYAPPDGTYDPATFGPAPVNFPDVPAPESAPVATTAPPAAPSRAGRLVNPGNWVYAGSRLPGEAPVRFPDQPPDVETGYGINRFDLPGGVAAYHVSQDYQDRQRQLEQQAAAARQARDQAVHDAQMLDQMMRVSRSMKDIEVARQQIDMQGLQRDLSALGPTASPVDQARIIARHPISASHLGAGYAAALKAQVPNQAIFHPAAGGAPDYFQLPGGGVSQVRPPPASSLAPQEREPAPIKDKNGNIIAWDAGGGHVFKAPPQGNVSKADTARLAAISREETSLRTDLRVYGISEDKKTEKLNRLGELDLQRRKILNSAGGAQPRAAVVAPAGVTGRINPMPKAKTELVAGQIYDTSRGAAQWDGNKFKLVETR
jgi:hypothetical protein